MPKPIDETGKRYGSLVVIELYGKKYYPSGSKRLWKCKCDCGNEIIAEISPLKDGRTISCGCYHKSHIGNKKHGASNTRLFRIWANMVNRCTNPHTPRYKDYGFRGITICEEWLGKDGSSNFIEWALRNGYQDNLTLDRINNDEGYSPSNCQWSTYQKQANNRRNNHLITYKGRTQTISQWADEIGLSQSVISDRLNKLNWSIEKTFETPYLGKQGEKRWQMN